MRRLSPRALLALGVTLASGIAIAVAVTTGPESADDEAVFTGVPVDDPGPVHVHGLGIDPADDALFIATHTGLYRAGSGSAKARRVGERFQDTMGFTVVGPNRFLGSGHPDVQEAQARGLPPRLGLIESSDAGKTWRSVSLLGEADFHVLRMAGDRVYGYDASNDRLLASVDGGTSWQELAMPGPLVDLVADAVEPSRLLASAAGELERGLYASRDAGANWTKVSGVVGLLAWPERNRLYIVDGGGRVYASSDEGGTAVPRGEIGGEPAALLAVARQELYVALHDGTIKRSTDGGATWTVRSSP